MIAAVLTQRTVAMAEHEPADHLSRRQFVTVVIAASAASTLVRADSSATLEKAASSHRSGSTDVSFTVNSSPVHLSLDSRATLLDTLRERLQLTGSKKGC